MKAAAATKRSRQGGRAELAKQRNAVPEQNPLVGLDDCETIENVRNVLEFMAWHRLEGEDTRDVQDGRQLILQACRAALRNAMQVARRG